MARNDCVIRAIAAAESRPYDTIKAELIDAGASPYCAKIGIWPRVIKPYLRGLGYVWTPTMGIGTGCRIHLRPDELPAGVIIASVSRHLVACRDGVPISDAFDPTRNGTRCVYGYWQKGGN